MSAEFENVEIHNPTGKFPCILACDHASATISPLYRNLGLDADVLTKHVASDIGVAPVVRALSHLLDAPAVLARQSRLLLDTNRWIADPESIPECSDGIRVPGNAGVTPEERQERQDLFFWPFHTAIASLFNAMRERHEVTYFIAVHSCTRKLSSGPPREMDGGTIWHERSGFADEVATVLTQRFNLTIESNAPYSGIGGTAFTVDYHTWGTGVPAFGLEIINDRLSSPSDQAYWTSCLATALEDVCTRRTAWRNSGDTERFGRQKHSA